MLSDYDPDLHFGGVYYLYLRGMHPENERGEGVFYTQVDSQLLYRLDAIFGSKAPLNKEPLNKELGDKAPSSVSKEQPPSAASQQDGDLPSQLPSGQQQFSFDDE